jgi:hypothetical protein
MLEVAATIIATRSGVATINAATAIPASPAATCEDESRIRNRTISPNSSDRGDFKDGFGKGLRRLLRQIVTDAACDDPMGVFP